MKQSFRRKLACLLTMAMLFAMLPGTALAAGSNLTIAVDKTSATVGDTVQVTLSIKEMTASSITGGFSFDTEKMTCTSIVGADGDDYFYVTKGTKNREAEMTAVSTVDEANSSGNVGFALVGTSDEDYHAGIVLVATFTAKADGGADFASYEDTAGADAFKGDDVETITTTVEAVTVMATGISLDQTTLSIVKGQTGTLTATVTPDEATDKTVTWSSSDDTVATVADGVVTAIAIGTATITAEANGTDPSDPTPVQATCEVTVTPVKVTEITLNATEATVNKGETYALAVNAVLPDDAENKTVTWSSDNTAVATVDTDGVVSGVAGGTANITATANDGSGVSATCAVTVQVAVDGVAVTPSTAEVLVGGTVDLTATVSPDEATNKNVTWTSSDDAIATVADGTVTGVAVGTATITATTEDGSKTATCDVTVNPVAVTGVSLDKTSGTLEVGRTETLTATVTPSNATHPEVTWSSDDEAVATVADGVVTAVAEGTATITVTTTDGGFTDTYDVSVIPVAVTGVSLDKSSAGMIVSGDSLTLIATVLPDDAANKNVSWTSSNPSVADVDASGTVTALAEGTATITVTTEDGSKTATCEITVSPKEIPVTGVTLDKEEAELKVGESLALTATLEPSDANTGTGISWSSSDPAVATVEDGAVTAVAGGTATITVTTEDGITASCDVTVIVPVTGVTVAPASGSIEVGDTLNLTATVTPSDATNPAVTWTSSDEAVATVSGGVVTGVATGTATITATTEDGSYTATATVTVTKPVVTYTITLNALGGTVSPATLTTDADGKVASLPTPTNSGYTFDGWFTAETGGDAVDAATVFTADTTIYAHWTRNSGGGGGGGGSSSTYTVKVATAENGTVKAGSVNAASGNVVTVTATPDKGYEVDEVTVVDALGKAVEVDKNENGTYSFSMPSRGVTVSATFKATDGTAAPGTETGEAVELPFEDVDETDAYYDDVAGVFAKGLMVGMSNTAFGPAIPTERGMIVTILYRLEGEPAVTGTAPFSDIAADQYYTNAVIWAAQKGIAAGYPDGSFQPTKTITREEMASFFFRYAVLKGYTADEGGNVHGFLDAENISEYALSAMNWAIANGYLLDTNNYILPQSLANRAQLAIFLNRFADSIE